MPGLCRVSGERGQDMETLIVGGIAVALIIYLFVVLLRPEKF
jgi:K+-transporting ATPase KdpF subunit